jgi:hypothetical protein
MKTGIVCWLYWPSKERMVYKLFQLIYFMATELLGNITTVLSFTTSVNSWSPSNEKVVSE